MIVIIQIATLTEFLFVTLYFTVEWFAPLLRVLRFSSCFSGTTVSFHVNLRISLLIIRN